MPTRFRLYYADQGLLLPLDIRDWLPWSTLEALVKLRVGSLRPIQERSLPCGVGPKLTRVVGIETGLAPEIIQTLVRIPV